MGTSITFDLIDQMVTQYSEQLPANLVHVVDGDIVTGDVATFLMVGWDDPDNDRATSVTAAQSWAGLGARSRDEEGAVTCLVVGWNGNGDLKEARTTVRTVTDAVEQLHRTDPNLGGHVPGLLWTGYGTRTELRQWLSEGGAVVTCTFEIAFKARI